MARKNRPARVPQRSKARANQMFARELYRVRYPELSLSTENTIRSALAVEAAFSQALRSSRNG